MAYATFFLPVAVAATAVALVDVAALAACCGTAAGVLMLLLLMLLLVLLLEMLLVMRIIWLLGLVKLSVLITERDICPCDMMKWWCPGGVDNRNHSWFMLLVGLIWWRFHHWKLLLVGQHRRMLRMFVWGWFNNW
jgi:hypothetical protein